MLQPLRLHLLQPTNSLPHNPCKLCVTRSYMRKMWLASTGFESCKRYFTWHLKVYQVYLFTLYLYHSPFIRIYQSYSILTSLDPISLSAPFDIIFHILQATNNCRGCSNQRKIHSKFTARKCNGMPTSGMVGCTERVIVGMQIHLWVVALCPSYKRLVRTPDPRLRDVT